MIVRVWQGRVSLDNPLAYIEHFRNAVLPQLCSIEGFLGASLLKAERAEEIDFVVLTRWSSMDAVRAFAGTDPTVAVVEPGAVAALKDFGQTVRHYEVVEEMLSPEGRARVADPGSSD